MECNHTSPTEVATALSKLPAHERACVEQYLHQLSHCDALTHLPNRKYFESLLQHACAHAQTAGAGVALMHLNLDHFREINSAFGHAVGDRTLVLLSERLAQVLPQGAVLGRLAGDEFAFYFEYAGLQAEAVIQTRVYAQQILTTISQAFFVQQEELFLTASMGVTFFPQDATQISDMLKNVDAAMRRAKQNTGNTVVFYHANMQATDVTRLVLKNKLRRALEHDELVMLYQPKVDLGDGSVVGSEALLRWRVPGLGAIAPAQFIPLAEQSSLILQIGEWVMDRVCADYSDWLRQGASPGRISINLSLKELLQPSFVARCRSIFQHHNMSPTAFELEITETTLMKDTIHTVQLLSELRELGVQLSLDDFGTGYSSLSAVQQFPINTIKIDQSFVRAMMHSDNSAAIVRSIITMGKSMQLTVVAEGVETQAQLEFLRQEGCHYAQGHLFGDAVSSEDFLKLMTAPSSESVRIKNLFGNKNGDRQ